VLNVMRCGKGSEALALKEVYICEAVLGDLWQNVVQTVGSRVIWYC